MQTEGVLSSQVPFSLGCLLARTAFTVEAITKRRRKRRRTVVGGKGGVVRLPLRDSPLSRERLTHSKCSTKMMKYY